MLQHQKSYKSIYSKPLSLNTRMNSLTGKKRKKGRGFPSQHQPQEVNKIMLVGSVNGSVKVKRKTSTSRFNPEAFVIPLVAKKSTNGWHITPSNDNCPPLHGYVAPSFKQINEENFKNYIVPDTQRASENVSVPKNRYSSTDRKSTVQLKSMKSKTGRGSMGSLMTGLPVSNHHYGLLFNTNSNARQSSEVQR